MVTPTVCDRYAFPSGTQRVVQTSWTHDDTPISAVCPLAFPPEGFAVIGTGTWIPAETGWRKQGPVGQCRGQSL